MSQFEPRFLEDVPDCSSCGRRRGKASGGAVCPSCGDGRLLRLVESQGYSANFGFQWNRFARTQLDSVSGVPISEARLKASTGCSGTDWKGQRILEVGCGSGRFTEVLLQNGAQVVAVDYSSAVEACWRNLSDFPGLVVVQGDLYRLPLKKKGFDCVICIGVLQHTPDPKRAFQAIAQMVRPGGRLVVDVYGRSWRSFLVMKYWIRPLTRRLPQPLLFDAVQRIVPLVLPLCEGILKIPFVGRLMLRAIPIAYYGGVYPLSREQLKEWAILDTFDMLSPQFDQPQTEATLHEWFKELGFGRIEVFKAGHLVGRGVAV